MSSVGVSEKIAALNNEGPRKLPMVKLNLHPPRPPIYVTVASLSGKQSSSYTKFTEE
jgi:hypothetical protein